MSDLSVSLLSIIRQDIRDRLSGEKARANARWGWVSPPPGNSKLIWLRAGASRDSVLLAAGLLAAIRQKRLDARLVLTYEQEYPDILAQFLAGVNKMGFGYACANHVKTESTMLARLQPFAIIFCGAAANSGIARALEKRTVPHLIDFQTSNSLGLPVELGIPRCRDVDSDQCYEAMTLLMQAQVDKQFSVTLNGQTERNLFLLNLAIETDIEPFLKQWLDSSLAESARLCLNPLDYSPRAITKLQKSVNRAGLQSMLLSEWDRTPIGDKMICILDEWRWYAATASSSLAIHLEQADDAQFWQSMASASLITGSDVTALPINLALPRVSLSELPKFWVESSQNPFQCRKTGDENRRVFWDYRRQAQQAVDDLLQKVFDW